MTPVARRNLCLAALCLIILATVYLLDLQNTSDRITHLRLFGVTSKPQLKPSRNYTQTLVVASTSHEDTTWISQALPDLARAIYIADPPLALYHPPANKGHESMVYLTYIIDHYHNLSDTTIFTHAGQESWHNNDLFDFDLAKMIAHISNEHVSRVGYFNLRCHHESGCPDHIKPLNPGPDNVEERYFAQIWDELHGPNAPPIPETLAVACCSQFAASREALTAISRERWVHYRDWLVNTTLPDEISGRIWEFTWHYILTGREVLCPALEYCYCDGFGLCFNDGGEIQSWLAMKEIATLAKHMSDDYAAQGKDGERGDVQNHLDQRISRPLNKWLYEAELRGQDPQTRALLSGRGKQWTEGDGF